MCEQRTTLTSNQKLLQGTKQNVGVSNGWGFDQKIDHCREKEEALIANTIGTVLKNNKLDRFASNGSWNTNS